MAHDVFVSYPAADKPTADALVATLEDRGVRCWVAPRDVMPGVQWADAIVHAVSASRLMVLVFSAETNSSHHVVRELNQAAQHGLPIIPLRVENVLPNAALEYYIAGTHWLDAVDPPLEAHLDRLANAVRGLLDATPLKGVADSEVVEEAVRQLDATPIRDPVEAPAEPRGEEPLLTPPTIAATPTRSSVSAAVKTTAPPAASVPTLPLAPTPPPPLSTEARHLRLKDPSAASAGVRRRPWLPFVIAAATLVAVVAITVPLMLSGDDVAPSASPSPAAAIEAPEPTGAIDATGPADATGSAAEPASVRQPKGFHVDSVGAYEVRLVWAPAPFGVAAENFLVFRDDERIGSVEEAAFTDSTVGPSHTYLYRVVAVGLDGSRASSKELTVTTNPAPTVPPSGTGGGSGGGGGGTPPQPSPTCTVADWIDGKC